MGPGHWLECASNGQEVERLKQIWSNMSGKTVEEHPGLWEAITSCKLKAKQQWVWMKFIREFVEATIEHV